MAYAQLAGVPAVFGLYTAMAAMVAYAFFGSSRELNQGPESAVAILTASMIAPIAESDPDRYLALAALLALLVADHRPELGAIVGLVDVEPEQRRELADHDQHRRPEDVAEQA